MTGDGNTAISAALAYEIEDAVMFGRPGDLETLVENIGGDETLPADLRYGLESLSYFRVHYGGKPDLSETDRKKIALMDQSWSAELLNTIRARIEAAIKRA